MVKISSEVFGCLKDRFDATEFGELNQSDDKVKQFEGFWDYNVNEDDYDNFKADTQIEIGQEKPKTNNENNNENDNKGGPQMMKSLKNVQKYMKDKKDFSWN